MPTSAVTLVQCSGIPEYNSNLSWGICNERLEIHFCEIKCTDESIKKLHFSKQLELKLIQCCTVCVTPILLQPRPLKSYVKF